MKKPYITPQMTAVEIRQGATLLTFSDPHNSKNEEGAWVGEQSLEDLGLLPD